MPYILEPSWPKVKNFTIGREVICGNMISGVEVANCPEYFVSGNAWPLRGTL